MVEAFRTAGFAALASVLAAVDPGKRGTKGLLAVLFAAVVLALFGIGVTNPFAEAEEGIELLGFAIEDGIPDDFAAGVAGTVASVPSSRAFCNGDDAKFSARNRCFSFNAANLSRVVLVASSRSCRTNVCQVLRIFNILQRELQTTKHTRLAKRPCSGSQSK